MMGSQALFDVAVILIFTKIFGIVTKKYRMTQVLGAVLAGIVLGPTGLHVLGDEHFIEKMAEIGVIIIIFLAGLETDITKLKKSSKASLLIAIFGVLLPLAGGIIASTFFNKNIFENIFIGVILTTTSVSITVETLIEMGKLKSDLGVTILGAAVIDDILGIIILTFIMGRYGSTDQVFAIEVVKILAFFVAAFISGWIFNHIFNWFSKKEGKKRRIPVLGFSFCLFMAFIAGRFGVPDIIGAYIAGLIISNTVLSHYVESKIEVLAYMFFAPMHFAHIGMKTVLGSMDGMLMLFTFMLIIIAIASKMGGCALGAKLGGMKGKTPLYVGIGMVCRGEIALIIANRGFIQGLVSEKLFTPIIVVIIITTILTPVLFKVIMARRDQVLDGPVTLSNDDLDDIIAKYSHEGNDDI